MAAGFPDGEELPEYIGPYKIRRRIGHGGMGVVYQAVDPEDRLVAVKVLRAEVAGDDIARARLAREVMTMQRVRSRNVAEVIDADTSAPLPWVVTEYIPGPTLDSTVTNHGPLRGRALTRVVTGLARALRDIHAAEVIHRDLKPGNVIISNGEPIIIDFGIAYAVDGSKLTQTGTFVGTPSYLSPEVIEGSDLSPATDIHAWGATVAFAATGKPPYGAGAFEVIFFRILNGEISLDGIPDALRPLVQAAVRRNPRSRPTAAQLVAETEKLNLDLPWVEDAYLPSGATGTHTVAADLPESAPTPAPAPEEEARTAVAESAGVPERTAVAPDQTMVAPDQTMAAPDQTMVAAEGFGEEDDEDDAGRRSDAYYYDATLRPEEFRDILTPVDYEGRNRSSDDYDDEPPSLLERFRAHRRGEDRISDYFGDDDYDEYEEAEARRLPWIMVVPVALGIVGLSLMLPTIGLVLGTLVVTVLGGLDLARREHARRLHERGPRSSDNVVVALSMPWALLRTLGHASLYGLGYLLAGIVVGIAIGMVSGNNSANAVGAWAVGLVVLMNFLFGPHARGAQRQSRWLVGKITIRNVYLYWGVIVAVSLLALFLVVFGVQLVPAWDPIPGPSEWFGS
ncbi:serine/threonine protein kinase [Thermobifida cellulosilytica TB100]|uniref:Serine/threonine protein kinase n=2 Tax=Thermobifida cellulosilytica TaxID=144786 RepID=A0A147KIV1_THECS|nr:serine/threonine protein kinase [Thermobifida cellulosilytica TB100]